jgi:hypothetical protein
MMNKIVRRFYPIEKLPTDLRSGLPSHGWVNIELDPNISEQAVHTVSDLVGSGHNVHGNLEAVLDHIQALRDTR